MIDNFETIEKSLLKFQEGSYYKFEALVRNTDGANALYYEGMSNTNKNILIKTWWIEDKEYYEKAKKEMKVLCDMTGARLYVLLDRMSIKKTLVNMHNLIDKALIEHYVQGCTIPAVKTIFKISGTASSIKDSSDKETRMWMFDIDVNDHQLLADIQALCLNRGSSYFTLATKKGWHVCAPKANFPRPQCVLGEYMWNNTMYWTLQENAMGLVYLPDKD